MNQKLQKNNKIREADEILCIPQTLCLISSKSKNTKQSKYTL